MNYRHAYHAGNFADVCKHVILTILLQHLRQKKPPFRVIDTHGGIGLYDLAAGPAAQTQEHLAGISRILEAAPHTSLPSAITDYLDIVGRHAPHYPGSPAIIRARLRDSDRLVACDLHPADGESLKRLFVGDKQVEIHIRDGYAALKAFLPPPEKRGLVLIDPPFEQTDEWDRLADTTLTAVTRWPTGLYALWYPVKDRPAIWRFHEKLAAFCPRPVFYAELTVHPETAHSRMYGTGMILINPPWQSDIAIEEALSALLPFLDIRGGSVKTGWLKQEEAKA
jgi:23S rRNA (adenine2030-N6)-methyltransferase